MATYDFTVRHYEADDRHGREGWSVFLPHQCDQWDIVGEGRWTTATHEQAVAEMKTFVAEAQEALEALVAGRPYGTR